MNAKNFRTFRKLVFSAWIIGALIVVIKIARLLIVEAEMSRYSSDSPIRFFDIFLSLISVESVLLAIGAPVAFVGALWTVYHTALQRNLEAALFGFEAILVGLLLGGPSSLKIASAVLFLVCLIWEQARDRIWSVPETNR